jgi:4-hydroxy-3-methylbut-2-enyl diphosphate reductase
MRVPAFLVDDPLEIKPEWFTGVNNIGITAGASAPEELTAKVIKAIKTLSKGVVLPMKGIAENINFSLPKGLV